MLTTERRSAQCAASAFLLTVTLGRGAGKRTEHSRPALWTSVIDHRGWALLRCMSPLRRVRSSSIPAAPGPAIPTVSMAAFKRAGVKQIDHLLLTHYHGDHVGGLQELATRIPIAHFIDHRAPARSPESRCRDSRKCTRR